MFSSWGGTRVRRVKEDCGPWQTKCRAIFFRLGIYCSIGLFDQSRGLRMIRIMEMLTDRPNFINDWTVCPIKWVPQSLSSLGIPEVGMIFSNKALAAARAVARERRNPSANTQVETSTYPWPCERGVGCSLTALPLKDPSVMQSAQRGMQQFPRVTFWTHFAHLIFLMGKTGWRAPIILLSSLDHFLSVSRSWIMNEG